MHGFSKNGRKRLLSRENLKALENIFQYSSTIFFEHDLEGNFLFISPQITEIIGYHPAQLKNKWQSIISDHPYNKKAILNTNSAIKTGQKQPPYEIEVVSKSGSKVWLEVNESPVIENGNIISIVGEAFEITKHKNIEKKLRDAEIRFSKIFQSSPNIIVISDIEDGRFIDINENGAKKLGYKKSELIGKTSIELGITKPEVRKEHINLLKRQGYFSDIEKTIFKKNGDPLPCSFYGQIIEWDEKEYLFQTIIDITERKLVSDKLKMSEEKFSKAFYNSPNAITLTSLEDGRILEINDFGAAALGYDRSEVLGKTSVELNIISSDDRERLFQELKKNGGYSGLELKVRTKDGREKIGLHYGQPITIGNKQYLFQTITDITEIRKAEQALRDSEEKFSKAFYLSPDAIIISRMSDGKIVELNHGFENIFGYPKDEAIGKTSLELNIYENPSDRDYIIGTIKNKGFIRNYEANFVNKKKGEGICEVSSQQIKIGEENFLLTIVRNITERKRAQNELKLSEEKFSKAFFSNQDGMIVTRAADGKIVEINKGIERIFGYSRSEAIGNTTIGLKFWSKLSDRKKVLSIIRKEGRVTNYVAEFNNKNGNKGTVEVSMELIKIDDEDFLITTVKDITQRKIIEEEIKEYQKNLKSLTTELALAEERERRRIAVNLHDHLGQSLALAKIKLSEAAKEKDYSSLLKTVSEARKYLDDSIADSRTITNDLSPPVLYELGFAAAIRWKLDRIADEHNIEVSFEDNTSLSNKLSEEVRVLLFRSALELINNAVKHSGATKLRVYIKNDKKDLYFIIEDNGKGFDLVSITINAPKNKSFGLFSIRERISYINGDMIINSVKRKGTKITLKIPRQINTNKRG